MIKCGIDLWVTSYDGCGILRGVRWRVGQLLDIEMGFRRGVYAGWELDFTWG
jgi:hypothetical protein